MYLDSTINSGPYVPYHVSVQLAIHLSTPQSILRLVTHFRVVASISIFHP